MRVITLLLNSILPGTILLSHAFKAHDFKTCSQSAFCRRGRALAQRASENASWSSPYHIDAETVSFSPSQSSLTARVTSFLYPEIHFQLQVDILKNGVVRVRMDEIGGLRKRYDEAASWALISEPALRDDDLNWVGFKKGKKGGVVKAAYGGVELAISYSPLKITLLRNGREEVVLNGRGLLHMEHFRNKPNQTDEGEERPSELEGEGGEGIEGTREQTVLKEPANGNAWFEGEEKDGYWEETFLSWTDSKPKGPESLSLDVDFPNHGHVYGIPQHAASLSLPSTIGANPHFSDPFRLYNGDVFEYDADSPVSLYGSIPLMHAHSAESTVGIFNALASETWIDILGSPTNTSIATHWISESGILDLFILPGPTPDDVFAQYASLTGTTPLPAHFAIAHHQCRWNYVSSDDVRTVSKRFDEDDMPVDVIWLDIEYSEEHKYFIWDEKTFPDPVEMANDVASVGRKMVVIIDPHLKRTSDYPVFAEAEAKKILVKKANGEDYEGWCWSGSSAWVDFFHPDSWEWWHKLFSLTGKTEGWRWAKSTDTIFIWNDMNEPSVFNGPEITMPKDSIHYGGWEHRDVHNINGMLYHNQTSQAVMRRGTELKRPFVLSRSFFAGSQRFGAIWTGDNLGTWEHMAVGIPMTLSNGIAGMTFAGADVGGFFGNPDVEMLVRWYQVGAFGPFFRAHAHIDTKRREPYLYNEPHKSMFRDILRLRYSLLPMWYTAFRETSVTGLPLLRPHYVVFPKDTRGFAIDDQYYVGSSGLLVKPVTSPGAETADVYLAEDEVYYDYFDRQVYRGAASGTTVTVPAPLSKIPLLRRGGSIISTRQRPRRASPLMKNDPFTLTIALDRSGTSAKGDLYLDDGETYAFEKGELAWRGFRISPEHNKKNSPLVLHSEDLVTLHKGNDVVDGVQIKSWDPRNAFAQSIARVYVERIAVLGLEKEPKSVNVVGGKGLEWTFSKGTGAKGKKTGVASALTIKAPGVLVVEDWQIRIEL
ncbi:glycoside hydrolase family 31 protein [Cantharellus anzutake]|uniref:glycoside hydrolase family 31 protein n=1 Tax=Cantharellus anzutake TaxID=1750568 RepID=UPI001903E989|nr:glycoside hydrolase family 31 protein [Cantharellus anzutake]KAF8342699.1 glycoside hydrolase family 31 protein [Cantharellus anzutake]